MVGLCSASGATRSHANTGVGEPATHVAEGPGLIFILDTGGVEALTPLDNAHRARLRAVLDEASALILPAAVLAEGVFTGRRSHDFEVRRLLKLVEVAPVTESVGMSAGALRQRAISEGFRPPPSAVDAIVIAEADTRTALDEVKVVTSDKEDLELLASLTARPRRLSILLV